MRNLTIKRTKSFVACLAKMKVYIEDPISGDLVINGVSCRKLGNLKNGEEKIFQIGDAEAKVFVIADKLSKNICNEFWQIPAGVEDVYLTGKNKYNPMTGNAFRFDGAASAEVLQNRKKSNRKSIIVMCAAIVIGVIVGWVSALNLFSSESDKVFSADNMCVTLTDAFEYAEYDGYTAAFESQKVALFALKEEFAWVEGFSDYTLDEYAELVFAANGENYELKKENGLSWFEYTETVSSGNVYDYYAFLYKSHDAFWMLNFAVSVEDSDKYEAKILEWAKSVEFGF
ncbi:MAG: hypothetical protein IJC50_09145 [Clostridia bacterium]|nr:hypothetical protein [Clostridia bacterium]